MLEIKRRHRTKYMKRVVVTGLGIVSPVGLNLKENWESITHGKSGVGPITSFELKDGHVRTAAEVKGFDVSKYLDLKEAKRMHRFSQFAVAASKMALEQSGLKITEENAPDVGVAIGSGIGSVDEVVSSAYILEKKGVRRISPFAIPTIIANMAAGHVGIQLGAKGPNVCTTTACASGAHAIADAALYIKNGLAKAMVCGGTEAAINSFSVAAFGQMRALCSKYEDEPNRASRPFDKDRCGFVIGEGSGVLVLEDYEHAKARGADILCEIAGLGMSCDAYHITAPDSKGSSLAVKQALKLAELSPESIDYVNAHATSTEVGDIAETESIKIVFGDHASKLNISSTKSMTGHLLGGAGGVEAIYTIMALKTGIIPSTINLENPDSRCDLNYTPNVAIERNVNNAVSNSFGFGGTNVCLVFRKLS